MIFSLAPFNGCITRCVTFPRSTNFSLPPCLLKIFQCQCPKPCFLPSHPLDVAQPLFLISLLPVQVTFVCPSSTLLRHRLPFPPPGALSNHSALKGSLHFIFSTELCLGLKQKETPPNSDFPAHSILSLLDICADVVPPEETGSLKGTADPRHLRCSWHPDTQQLQGDRGMSNVQALQRTVEFGLINFSWHEEHALMFV